MKSKLFLALALFVAVAAVAACSSSKPQASSGVAMSAQMKPSEFSPQVMTYRNPSVDIRQYNKVLLEPVEIYKGPDAEFKGATPEEQQEMASFLQTTVQGVLVRKGLLTTEPGPGVVRLKLILAGLEKTRPAASAVTHAFPVGLALNLGKGAMGKNGSFMGTATVGGEFTDSKSGALVASFVAKEGPNAMDLPAVASTWGASKEAITKIARQIGDRLEKIRVGER